MIVRPNGRKVFEAPAGPRRDRRLARTRRDPRPPCRSITFEDVYRFGQLLESAPRRLTDQAIPIASCPQRSNITLLGAGLVGSSCPSTSSAAATKVTVYERRPDMRQANISAGSRSTSRFRPRLARPEGRGHRGSDPQVGHPHARAVCCIRCRASSATSATGEEGQAIYAASQPAQLRADDPRRAVGRDHPLQTSAAPAST